MFEESPADVVLLDIEMPGAESKEIAARILDAKPRTKIIVMTAMPRDDPRVRSIVGMGGYEVMEKPVKPEALARIVHAIQSGSRDVGRLR